jgi:putative membrane protein
LNLARIELQTASAQSKAEMTIEGFMEFEAIRDFLYSKMHGAELDSAQPKLDEADQSAAPSVSLSSAELERLNQSLQATTEALREVRLALQERRETDAEKTD